MWDQLRVEKTIGRIGAIHSIVTGRDVSVKDLGNPFVMSCLYPTFATIFIGQQQLEVAVLVL